MVKNWDCDRSPKVLERSRSRGVWSVTLIIKTEHTDVEKKKVIISNKGLRIVKCIQLAQQLDSTAISYTVAIILEY